MPCNKKNNLTTVGDNNNGNNNENEILYAVTNGEMNEKDDLLNVSNSTIIVTRRELKVLKKEDNNMNDDYVFLNPSGVCYDDWDNLYICDSGFNRVKVRLSLICFISFSHLP